MPLRSTFDRLERLQITLRLQTSHKSLESTDAVVIIRKPFRSGNTSSPSIRVLARMERTPSSKLEAVLSAPFLSLLLFRRSSSLNLTS